MSLAQDDQPPRSLLHTRRASDEALIEEIAERAAVKAMEKLTSSVYQEIGRNVVQKLFYIIGASVAAWYVWLKAKGLV